MSHQCPINIEHQATELDSREMVVCTRVYKDDSKIGGRLPPCAELGVRFARAHIGLKKVSALIEIHYHCVTSTCRSRETVIRGSCVTWSRRTTQRRLAWLVCIRSELIDHLFHLYMPEKLPILAQREQRK